MAKFYSTKTYGNDKGLSCCFRQWGATHSHCSLLHGYSIGIKIVFECAESALILPHPIVDIERVSSAMNYIKSKLRNEIKLPLLRCYFDY